MAERRSGELHARGAPVVAILTGSPSDLDAVRDTQRVLRALGVPSELHAMSAHRTPDRVARYAREARERGLELIIACAGLSAHLAGVVASHTTLPVIGVPLSSGALSGLDALLSTVQMPPGVPVATVGVDGLRNAGFLAARMLAGHHPELVERIEARLEVERARYGAAPGSPAERGAATKKRASHESAAPKHATEKAATKKRTAGKARKVRHATRPRQEKAATKKRAARKRAARRR